MAATAVPTGTPAFDSQQQQQEVQACAAPAEDRLSEKTPLHKQLTSLCVVMKLSRTKLIDLFEQLVAKAPVSVQKQLAQLMTLLRLPGIKLSEMFERLKARHSATALLLLGSVLAQTVASWSSGLPIMAIERYAPHWIARYKIQPDAHQPTRKVLEMMLDVGLTQVVASVLAAIATRMRIPALERVAERSVNAPLPSFPRILGELGFNLLSWEVVFYAMHRLFHTRRLYKHVHKKHHSFKAPVALASAYATTAEHIFGDALPGVVGSALLQVFANSNVVNMWIWFAFGSVLTNINHSGYYFPWFPLRECTMMHDYHHYSFYSMHGLFGWMDRLFGTDGGADYVRWRAENLRRILGQ